MKTAKKQPQKPTHAPGESERELIDANTRRAIQRRSFMVTSPTAAEVDLARQAFMLIADGVSLLEAARHVGLHDASLRAWVSRDEAGLHADYARARECQALRWAEELLEIADDGRNDWMKRNDPANPGYEWNGEGFNRSRLRVDTRKWLLSKVLPKVYGDKSEGGPGCPLFNFTFNALPGPPAVDVRSLRPGSESD